MKASVRICLLAAAAMVIFACASAGKQFDRTHVNDIKKGIHTKSRSESGSANLIR